MNTTLGIREVAADQGISRMHWFDDRSGRVIKVGRMPSAQVRLSDPDAARIHATITRSGDRLTLVDMGSISGTEVNGERVRATEIQDGDVVRVGQTYLEIELEAGRETARPLAAPAAHPPAPVPTLTTQTILAGVARQRINNKLVLLNGGGLEKVEALIDELLAPRHVAPEPEAELDPHEAALDTETEVDTHDPGLEAEIARLGLSWWPRWGRPGATVILIFAVFGALTWRLAQKTPGSRTPDSELATLAAGSSVGSPVAEPSYPTNPPAAASCRPPGSAKSGGLSAGLPSANTCPPPKPETEPGTPMPPPRVHEVKPGDTLSKLAERYYSDPLAFSRIFSANRPPLHDPAVIEVGTTLTIP